tara:strand:+ start:370 stop:510 length:141 start_codon:yes stop_codon:yes gene_type:complete
MNSVFLSENAENTPILAKIAYFFTKCDIFITKFRAKLNNSEIINIF